MKATDNGDCLYNATSIALCRDESLALLLRLLVSGELFFFNTTYYAEHLLFSDLSSDTNISVETQFSIALKSQAEKKVAYSGQVQGSEGSSVVYMCCWGRVIFLDILAVASVI